MKLKQKTFLFFISITACTIIFYFLSFIPFARNISLTHLENDVQQHFLHFNIYLKEFQENIIHSLNNLAENEEYQLSHEQIKQLSNYLAPREDGSTFEISDIEIKLRNNLREFKETDVIIENVYVGFENGSIITNRGRLEQNNVIYDPRERSWYQLAKENQDKALITEFYPSNIEKKIYYVSGAKSLKNKSGEMIGAIGFDINLKNLLYYLSKISELSYGELFLLQTNSLISISKNNEIKVFNKNELLELKNEINNLNGNSGNINFKNEKNYVMILNEEQLNWTLIYKIPSTNFNQLLLKTLLPFTLKGILLILISLILIGIGLNSLLFIPIKRLIKLSRDIVKNGEIPEAIYSKDDDELGILSTSFREMAIELKEHKDNLTQLIDKRTLELSKYSMIVEQSSTIIVMTDPKGNLEYVNSKFLNVTGYSKEEVLGKNPRILKSGITPPETFIDLWQTISSGESWRGELCNKNKNGELFWEDASIFPVKNNDGEIINYVAVKEDITEKKNNETIILENDKKLKYILDSSPAMIAIRDKKGLFKTINREYKKFFEKNYDEIINKSLFELYPDEQAKKIKIDDEIILDRGETLIKDIEIQLKGPKKVFYEIKFPIKNMRDEIIEVGEWALDITERVKSENDMKLLLKSINEGIIGVDINLRVKFINDSALELLDTTREDVLNQQICDVIFSKMIDDGLFNPLECPIYNSIKQQKKINVPDAIFWKKNNSKINVEYTSVPIINDDVLEGAVVVFRDITEKLNAQKTIRENEERFRFSLETIGAFYWTFDIKTRELKYDSSNFLKQYGYLSEPPVILEDWLKLVHLDDAQIIYNELMNYLSGTSNKYENEVRLRKKSGDYTWIMTIGRAIEWNENGDITKLSGITLDINQRKKTEQFLENMFEATPVPVFISPLKSGKPFRGNQAVLDFLECSREEFLSTEVNNLYFDYENDRPKLILAFQNSEHVEIRIKTMKSKEIRWCLFSGREIEYEEEECILGTFIDITELKKAKETAENATKSKSNFLANMSHEIRTPMNAIIGLNDLLSSSNLTLKQKDYVEKISWSANSLLGIINDILDFSKIEAGKLKLENIQFNLDTLLNNITNIIAIKAYKKNLELVIIKDSKVPNEIIGDPLRLQQILLNLLNNAIKFTETGEIVLRISQHSRKYNVSKLCFNIIDTGIGMTKEQVDRLFNSFSQADESTTRKYGGTGLGLTISKLLVEMMDGNIHAKSKYGQGSSFFFDIDFQIIESDESAYKDSFSSLKDLNILVVENNKNVRTAIKSFLYGVPKHLKLISSSKEAIKKIKKNQYDLIILDYSLPELNGINTWEKIKTELKHSKLPKLIMIASYGEKHFEYLSLNAGIDNILYKPLSKQKLLEIILENFSLKTITNIKSTFSIELPEGFDDIRGAKILLVEDNRINQQVAKELLVKQEFWVDIAENGQEAIEMVEQKQYDLVLLDLQMPVVDGYEAAEIIRKKHNFNDLPLVALSADAMTGTKERVLEKGMNDYITKPINKNLLFKVLTKWIKPLDREKNLYESENNDPIIEVSKLKETLASIDIQDALRRVSGNVNLYISLLSKFHHDYSSFLLDLAELINRGKKENVLRAIHSLKGLAGNLGAKNLNKTSTEIESIMNNLEIITLENTDIEIKALKISLDASLKEIKTVLEYIDEHGNKDVEKTVEISKEQLLKKMQALRESIESYNTDAFSIHKTLKKFLVKEELKDKHTKLGKLIEEYEFEKALKIYEELVNLL